MKMLKNNKKLFIGLILGIIISSITIYAANQYLASDVKFTPTNENWNVTNVNDAINDLYNEDSMYLRYDEENNYIQAKDENGDWVNIYETDQVPISARKYLIKNGSLISGFTLTRLDSEETAITPYVTTGNGYIQLSQGPRTNTYGNGCTYSTKVDTTGYTKLYLKLNHYNSFGYQYRTSDYLFAGGSTTSASYTTSISTSNELGVTYELDVSNIQGTYYVGYLIQNQSKYLTGDTSSNIAQFIDMWLE